MLNTSCGDFLGEENKSAGGTTADDYFSTAEGQASLRVYTFSLLKPLVSSSYNSLYDDGTDIYWPNRRSPSEFDNYTLTYENSTVTDFYSACYKLINNANALIDYGGNASDAKFLRSYAYYLLTQQFGSVPYITYYINNANRNFPRTPLQEIYDGILADLEDVLADADVPTASAHDGTVNKQAANALAAKVALAAGWDLNVTVGDAAAGTYSVGAKTYFERAAKYAEAAISGVTPYDNFADKWSYKNDETNQEEFFSYEYDRATYPGDVTSGGHDLQQDYGFYYGNGAINGTKQCGSSRGISLKSMYLFDSDDARYQGTFACEHYNYNGTDWPKTGYYAKYVCSESELATLGYAMYYAPWYWSKAQFEKFLADNQAKFAKGDYQVAPTATHLKNPARVVKFNADGSIMSSTEYAFTGNTQFSTGTDGGDCVSKWDDPETLLSAGSKQSYRDIVLLHWSESVLTAAEAYLLAGNEAKALEYLNKLRSRAGASQIASFASYAPAYVTDGAISYNVSAIDVVLDERARELYGEPGRWVDLRRTKQLEHYFNAFVATHSQIGQSYQPVKWLRPIPSDEINNNESISLEDQNPGY